MLVNMILKGNALAILSIALWGMAFPITEILLMHWHPLLLASARLLSASICLIIILLSVKKTHQFKTIPWTTVWYIGGLGVGVGTVLLVWGQQLSDPVTASILVTTLPIIAILLGWSAGDEKLDWFIFTGVFLAITGGIIAAPSFSETTISFGGGEILILMATILYAWYSRCCQRQLNQLSGYITAAVTLGTGGLVALIGSVLCLLFGLIPYKLDFSTTSVTLIIALGLGSAGISTYLWIISTRMIGVTLAAFYVNLAPFFVMLANIALGGKLSFIQLLAAVVVVTGSIIAQLPRILKKL